SSGAAANATPGNYAIVPSAPTGGTFTAANYAITLINGSLIVSESSNADLSSLKNTGGTLSPEFDPAVTNYTIAVANNITSLAIVPVPQEQQSTITINNVAFLQNGNPPSQNLAIGSTVFNIKVTAGNGVANKTYVVTVSRAEAAQVIVPPSGNVTVSNTTPQVVITSPTQPVVVTVPAGTTNPTVDYGNLTTNGVATIPQTTVNTSAAAIAIPPATTVTSSNPSWDGVIAAPVVSSYIIPPTPGQIATTGLAIEVGDPNSSLSFSKAVRLVLPGQAGKQAAFVHGGIYTEIINTGTADTQAEGDALPADGAFKIDVGADLVIWTKVFSTFVTFTRAIDPDVALVALDKAALTEAVVKATNTDLATAIANLNTPATGSNGSAFTWLSNNTAAVSNAGIVTRPVFGSGNATVTLTVTIKKGLITDTKTFNVVVVEMPNQAPTMAAIAAQVLCTTTGVQTVGLTGITAGPETAQTTTLTVSSNNAAMFSALTVAGTGTTGTVSYTLNPNAVGVATVTITVKDNGGVANGGSDTFTRTFTVTANALPTVNIVSDLGLNISKGATARLSAPAESGVTYAWTNTAGVISGQNTATLTIRPTVSGTYTLTATNASGCVTVKSITINVAEDYQTLLATNILTPNGDGVNDKWVIANLDMYTNNVVKVFDRAGRVIFTEANYKNSWDATINGSPLAEGTYYYTVDFGAGKLTMKGFITIVRNK
ncbi:MAG: T9SS type B sorting domain-containing protein, partial [Sphingobacteriales bacterium]